MTDLDQSRPTVGEIDRDHLRRKYAEERDKRLRDDGNAQYVSLAEHFPEMLADPWTEPAGREPITDEADVVFIGGGFAGLVTGARLKQAGVTDVRIIEKGGDFGGTWYWNRYPGAQCDTTSFVYLPLLEETGHVPTEKYAHAPEILEHCRRIGRHFDLYDGALFQTEVTGLTWDGASSRWIVETNRGDAIRARFVAMGTGPLHVPKLPGIPGIESFAGHSFHTSRWDYRYTGGDPAGAPMTGLADKRVAVIGTGATAVQCVPHLARDAGELFVFQRTPSSIDVRANHDVDVAWFEEHVLEPGWQKKWLENFTVLQTGGFAEEDLVKDGWTDIAKRIRDRVVASGEFSPEAFARAYEESDDEKMTEIRARVDAVVRDPETAEALKPWYRQLCKRPCFHDEYLDAYNRPNTHLVDTDGKGVARISERGVVVDTPDGEVTYEVDCIVYASGFEVGTDYTRRAGYDVVGEGGVTLSSYWSEGMRSYHGIHVHGFPNLFVNSPSQAANLISNIPHNLTEAGETIAAIVSHALEEGIDEVAVPEEVQDAWVERLMGGGRAFGGNLDCTPGYYNNEGQDSGLRGRRNSASYPEGPMAYFAYIDAWRSNGRFEGLELRTR